MTNRKLADIVKCHTLEQHESVQQACRCMWECDAGSVLVVDGDQQLIGIFTGRDAVRTLAEGKNTKTTQLMHARRPIQSPPLQIAALLMP